MCDHFHFCLIETNLWWLLSSAFITNRHEHHHSISRSTLMSGGLRLLDVVTLGGKGRRFKLAAGIIGV